MAKPAPAAAKKEVQGGDKTPTRLALAFALALSVLSLPTQRRPEGLFGPIDLKWNDQLFRFRGPERPDERIMIVTIDDESIQKVGQYPWPRHVYRDLLQKMFKAGVKVVAMDVLFLDPSYPQEDAALIEATVAAGKNVVHAGNRDPSETQRIVFRRPFAKLAKVAKSVGSVDQLLIDDDGSVRKTYLMFGSDMYDPDKWPTDKERVPGLGVRTLAVYEGKDPDAYLAGRRNRVYLNLRGQLEKKKGVDHTTGEDIVVTDFMFPRLAAWRLLEGRVTPDFVERLKGAIVFVGSTAVAAFDKYPSPYTSSQAGVEVHANVVDNLLHDRFIRESIPLITIGLCFAFALLSSWIVGLNPLVGALAEVGLLLGWLGATYFSFTRFRLLDFTPPTLSLIGPYAVLMIRKTLSEQQEKRFIKQTFGQFVAPEVVDKLVKDPSQLKLGGEKREMTVFFLDIAHFTTISEKMDPESLILFLNRYLSALSKVVHDHKGVVDKYIGDCIMAFWNAPLDDPDHHKNACLTAVECQLVVAELNKDLDPKLPERPAIRIGVNSGDMTVGLTGSEKKLAYTVIGDEVNLASRLEGANKFFGSNIMVSEGCIEGAKDAVEYRILGQVRVVGKSIPIKVFELLAAKGKLSPEWQQALPSYEKAVELFLAEKFQEAKDGFGKVLALIPDDKPSKLYFNACDDYIAIPPMGDWRVFNLTAK